MAWLAENRVLRSRCNSAAAWPTIPTSALRAARFAATYAWWIGLVERAISHPYRTRNEISAQFGRVILTRT